MTTNYPIIANCNYESSDDTTIHTIRLALDKGLTKNAELIEAMGDLESVLAEHAESPDESSVKACAAAEQDVLDAWTSDVQAECEEAQERRYVG